MDLQIKDKVKFRSVSENLVKIGLIKNITHKLNNPNNKYEILADDGELYLNVYEDDIISFLGFGPSYVADDECNDTTEEQVTNYSKVDYKRGDCVYIKTEDLDEPVIITHIRSDIDNRYLHVIDLLGRSIVLNLSDTTIYCIIGNIVIPGFGEVNEERVPMFNDFKYHYGDIVSVSFNGNEEIGTIVDCDLDDDNQSLDYKIAYCYTGHTNITWANYNEIEPGDYRMKEQENKITMEDIRNCFDDDFVADSDDKCDAEEDYRCPYEDKIGCPVEIFTGPYAPLQSFKDISEIRFDKPEITIVYSNDGESNVELPKNAYNKKVGFLLAYLKGILDDIEYARVIGVMKSINKDTQQIINFDETCNEDD